MANIYQRIISGRVIFKAAFLALFVGTFLFIGCSGCDDYGNKASGKVNVAPSVITISSFGPGLQEKEAVLLENLSEEGDLVVYSLSVERDKDIENSSTAGLSLTQMSKPEAEQLRMNHHFGSTLDENVRMCPVGREFTLEKKQGEKFDRCLFYVSYQGTGVLPKANLVVRSSDPAYSNVDPLTRPIEIVESSVEILVTPDPLRIRNVQVGNVDQKVLKITNIGSSAVEIPFVPQIIGGNGLTIKKVSADGQEITSSGWPYRLESASTSVDGLAKTLEIVVEYKPVTIGDSEAQIEVSYRAPGATVNKTKRVNVLFTGTGPSIYVGSTSRDFGQVPIHQKKEDFFHIENIGNSPLTITEILLSKNSADNEFEVSLSNFPEALGTPSSGNLLKRPVVVAPDQKTPLIELSYLPLAEGSDIGELLVKSDDLYQPELKIDLRGRGTTGACPIVHAGAYVEGLSVTPVQRLDAKPLDYVILDASGSTDPDGRVVSYEWKIDSVPLGGTKVLEPTKGDVTNRDFSRRRYRPLVAGKYEFTVNVKDNEGILGCSPKHITLIVTPSKKIHIELTWRNPEDEDETDKVGSDVDLHLVKMGPGLWFKKPYDIYFLNKNTVWHPETPTLDIDDRDGAGPENIQLDNPGNCEWYAVGVDYYKQLKGTAYVTIRIYINKQLKYEAVNLPLSVNANFYDMARIHWSGHDATIIGVEQFYDVRPENKPPVVTPSMKVMDGTSHKYCTVQNLY